MKILKRKFDKKKIVADFHGVARIYNIWAALTESKATKKALDLADIHDYQKIIEPGCGTGVLFEQIVRSNPNGLNIGIDLSPDMIEKARKRLKKLDTGHYDLRQGDALQLDFPDNYFDTIINNFMVDLLPEEYFDTIAGSFFRILKPNGIIVISTFSFGKKRIHTFWYWLAKHLPGLLTGCRPVSFQKHLQKVGFVIENQIQIGQFTFPSEVIKARK